MIFFSIIFYTILFMCALILFFCLFQISLSVFFQFLKGVVRILVWNFFLFTVGIWNHRLLLSILIIRYQVSFWFIKVVYNFFWDLFLYLPTSVSISMLVNSLYFLSQVSNFRSTVLENLLSNTSTFLNVLIYGSEV